MAADATWKTPNPVIQAMSKMTPSQNNMGFLFPTGAAIGFHGRRVLVGKKTT
jgi:hypothetical protein